MGCVEHEIVVDAEYAGQRLDKAVAELLSDFSRSELSRWIASGALTLDGAQVKPRHKLRGGECIRLRAEIQPREDWSAAQPIPLNIVYEDEHLLIVDKVAGMVVHPGAGVTDGTLVNALLNHRPGLCELPRAGIVHRLDKDTTGLMVIAGTGPVRKALVRMIAEREVERTYLAVAEGVLVAGQDIDKPIGRDPKHRTRQAIVETGKPAFTRVRIEERFRRHTLLRAQLGSGRTHQIRVHLQSIGHPLVGDPRYGARRLIPKGAAPELIEMLQRFPRQALHAAELRFAHPVSGDVLESTSALPADLEALVEQLREDT